MVRRRRKVSNEFLDYLFDVLNGGMVTLLLSIGHRTGLLDALATLEPSSSEAIASAAGLDERYVREWLAAMTTAGIVEYDAATTTYVLPEEHAAWLTRAAGTRNLAVQAQYVGLLATVQDEIVECFRHGGGVPYSSYPMFQALMAEESRAVHDASLLDVTIPLVGGLAERLAEGIDVADVGCGSGHALVLLATAFPNSRFVGYDVSSDALDAGRSEARGLGLENLSFVERDAAALDEVDRFDFVTTFDAVHDQARPDLVLRGIAHSLRVGGTFLCVDIAASSALEENYDHPLGPFLYTVSCMHCMAVSLADGGMGLGTMWGEQRATEMLLNAGFSNVDVVRVPGDLVHLYYVATREP
jgi:SAM-dependent methyltransferase